MNKNYGFGDELDDLSDIGLAPEEQATTVKPTKQAVKAVAEASGWKSREAEPKAILSIRADRGLINEFKKMAKSQEPKWQQEYLLRRALDALKKELERT